ncbi:sodium:solute symporter family protein [Spirochaeta africana]|uniref:Na+/proline symporter n=1 Tax=Spirochaeta africana (strain ATCC 700263 / DSM 8902 / Z-7692) TaxID=889378 RepID=H9UIN6_SPIAZ|nr:sodium:solute symporter family protein [Spirochaeta africana]AFG37379.1 Na+/proline symporter [Spirochaeta africana DSM 8902]
MLDITALSIFGLIIIGMAAYGYKVSAKTAEDYMLAGRSIGVVVMFFFVLFAISSSWTFYGFPGVLYLHGPGYVFFIWGSVAGFAALYMFLGPKLWALSKLNRFLSPIEVLSERYESKSLRVILSVTMLAFIVPYVGIQPLGVGRGFEALTGMPLWVGATYTVVLLLVLVILGGMRIVAWVNIFLGAVYITALLGSLFWVVVRVFPDGGLVQAASTILAESPEKLSTPGPLGEYSSVLIIGTFVVGLLAFSWPHVVIGGMTARDKNLFKWLPLLVFAFGGLFFYIIPFIWGSLVAPAIMPGITDPGQADQVVQSVIQQVLPRWFAVFVLMGVIAAAVSTAAVQLMTTSIIVARDLVQGVFKPDATDQQVTAAARYAVLGIVVLSLSVTLAVQFGIGDEAMALYLTDVSVPGFAQWAPALVGGLLWRRANKQGAIAGTTAGVVYLVLGLLITSNGSRFLLLDLHPVVPTLLLNLVVFIVVSLVTERPREEIQEIFFDEVDDFLRSESSVR